MANNAQVNFTIAARNQASGAIAGVNKSLGGLRAKTIAVGSAIGTALGTVAVQAFAKLTDFVGSSIGAASNLNETMSKTKVIFGEAAEGIIQFANAAADNIGMSKQSAMDAASTFGVFAKSAGLAGGDLSKFSTDLVTLSADFASFYNTSPEQAITAIGAALRGESEPIRKYGVILNDMELRQYAFRLGLVKTTKQALTPQIKVLAANAAIMDKSRVAQGDYANTSGGLANQQRKLAGVMQDLSADLGTAFLPILQEAIGFITGTAIPTFRNNFVPLVGKLKEVFETLAATIKGAVAPVMEALQKPIGRIIGHFKLLMIALKPVVEEVGRQLYIAFFKLRAFMQNDLGPAIEGFSALLNGPLGLALKMLVGAIVGVKLAFMAYNAVLGVWSALQTAGAAITGVFTAAQAALNVVLNMNPIGLLVLAIAALVGAFAVAYASSEDFRKVVNGIFDAITGVIGVIVGGLVGAFELLIEVANTVGQALMSSPLGVFFKLAMAVADGIGSIVSAVFNSGGGDGGGVVAPTNRASPKSGGGNGTTNVNVYTTLDGQKIATSVDTRIGARVNAGTMPRGNQ
jgi:hypothetical protein